MSSETLHPSTPAVACHGRPQSGLNFSVARTLEEVEEAWSLVYQVYTRDDLIDVNPFQLHTTRQAAGPDTAVIMGCLGPLLVGTVSAYTDGGAGLPLDSVYLPEIDEMRRAGRRVAEVGLFADRREHINRSADGLFSLMRFVYYFFLHLNIDDAVIGVHPRHAPFYTRLLGFEMIGPMRSYPTVKDRAVVLLRSDVKKCTAGDSIPKGLSCFLDNPVEQEVFANRFRFDDPRVASSRIGQFLAYKDATIASAA